MKQMLVIVAAAMVLTPLAAHAQERMSDARYLAANRCLAYADLAQLQGDSANFANLREAAAIGNRERMIATQVRQDTRSIRARASSATGEELRARRDEACARFVDVGLVQLGASGS
ncbi:MAG TPA: hypothetical protein PLK37_08075 [Terricaulis sp.]|nr:hypothetical protein [Terricaulis sp.]